VAVEGFELLGSVSVTLSSGANAFGTDITFGTETPTTVTREIQIQIYAGLSSILFIRRNGTDFAINNNVAVVGAVTFTILVLAGDTLNFRTDGTNIPLNIIVGGG